MKLQARGAAALCLGVGLVAFSTWVCWAHGLVATTAAVLAMVTVGLAAALVRQRRESRRLERALGRERELAQDASDYAWQTALLTRVVGEAHPLPDPRAARGDGPEDALLQTAMTALVRALEASRAVVYERDSAGALRLRAQFAAAGVAPLDDDDVLPAVLASDRELAERLSSSHLTGTEDDPEIRALAARLGASSIVIAPVGASGVLAVHRCDAVRSWKDSERRVIQRFAEQLATALSRADEHRRQSRELEARAGLVRVARALFGARETRAVLDIATSVGAPLARARASAIFVGGDDDGFRVAAEHGFAPGFANACVQSLEIELEDAMRTRLASRLRADAVVGRRLELKSLGPVAIVPLHYGREALGVFLFEKPPGEDWSETGDDIAEALAELTAAALKNASLFEAQTSSEARFADLYDNASDLYQTLDRDGRIVDCNRAQCLALGYTKQDLVGRRLESILAKECISAWRRLEAELFVRGQVHDASLKLCTRDGRTVDVVANASVMRASNERPLSARVVMRDVSEQRRLELQLRQRQKLELVGALAGGIVHDFNNVLGGILGHASLLRAQLRDRPHAQRYVETIERAAVRGAELTGRLLAAFRKTPARTEAVNVNDVVEETLELLARTFHERIRIGKRLDPRVRPILADAGQLQQIVLNLCVNARDAMPEGGLLRVETEVDDRHHRLRLTVEDSGVGMKPATIGRVFEPFFSTKGERGSGLGLSIVYSIVKSLGGDVRVNSSPGKGARFEIFIPTNWVDTHEHQARPVEPVRGRGELVLFVDDELVLRELGTEILESHGYRVQAVASGEDALAFIRSCKETVALVILDLVMPGLDGGETFRRLRDVDTTVPVLLSSGLSAEDAVEEFMAEGARGFIPKPYGIGELTRAVSTVLQSTVPPLMH